MIRTVVCILSAFILLHSSVCAQISRIDSLEVKYADVHIENNGNVIYLYGLTKEKNKKGQQLKVDYFLGGLGMPQKLKVDLPDGTIVLSTSFTDAGFVLLTANPTEQKRTIMLISYDGTVMQQQTEDKVSASLLTPETKYYIGSNPGAVYIIAPVEDKRGYKMLVYDGQMKLTAEKVYTSKNSLDIIDLKQEMDRVYVLRKETVDEKKQKYKYNIHHLSPVMPDMQFVSELNDNGDYCFPLFINVFRGMVYTGGMSYKDGKYDEGKATGVQAFIVSADGQLIKKVKLPVSKMSAFLPDAAIASLAKNTALCVLDVIGKMDGSMAIVCEMLSKDVKGKSTELKIADMLVMHIDMQDEMTRLQFVESPSLQYIELTGKAATYNLQNTATWLKQNDLFNYKFTGNVGGEYNLCYMSTDTMHVGYQAMLTTLDSCTSQHMGRVLLTKLPDPQKPMKRKLRIRINADNADETRLAHKQGGNIIPLNEVQVVVYNYALPYLNISIEPLRK